MFQLGLVIALMWHSQTMWQIWALNFIKMLFVYVLYPVPQKYEVNLYKFNAFVFVNRLHKIWLNWFSPNVVVMFIIILFKMYYFKS